MRTVWLLLVVVAAAALSSAYAMTTNSEQVDIDAREQQFKVFIEDWGDCVPFRPGGLAALARRKLPTTGLMISNMILGNQTRKVNCLNKEGQHTHPSFCGSFIKKVETARTCVVKLDCVLGNWLPWDRMPDGSMRRLREIIQMPQGGGKECPVIEEVMPVAQEPTARWVTGSWGDCKVSVEPSPSKYDLSDNGDDNYDDDADDEEDRRLRCGGGTQRRGAHCASAKGRHLEDAKCAHLPMPTLVQPCEIPCPRDCQVGPWSEWSPCLPVDGCPLYPVQQLTSTGYSVRRRRVTSAASGGGAPCPPLEEKRSCAQPQCATWVAAAWGPCTLDDHAAHAGCGPGHRTRLLRCVGHDGKEAEHVWCAGTPAPARSERCRIACAGDCVVSLWGDWGDCSAECVEPGMPPPMRTRHRHILAHSAPNKYQCPPDDQLVQHEPCNRHSCATYSWLTTPWGRCEPTRVGFSRRDNYTVGDGDIALMNSNEPCVEEGEMRRDVMCVLNNADIVRDLLCAPLKRPATQRACTTRCRRNCRVDPWQPWTPCPESCNPGRQMRLRSVRGGPDCGIRSQIRDCPLAPSCKDGVAPGQDNPKWVTNSYWSPCVTPANTECGNGISVRQLWCGSWDRRVDIGFCAKQPVPRTVSPCYRNCNLHKFNCTAICDDAINFIDFSTTDIKEPKCTCPQFSLAIMPEDSDCILPPGLECGEGRSLRAARCLFKGKHVPMVLCRKYYPLDENTSSESTNGFLYDLQFPDLLRMQCTVSCTRDCVLGPWGEWGPCLREAGTLDAYTFRSRSVLSTPSAGGRACGPTLQRAPCTPAAARWHVSEWGPCLPQGGQCGPAVMNRTVYCVGPEGNKVEDDVCGASPVPTREMSCRAPCVTDCVVSQWSEWSDCQMTKYGGRRDRTRVVLRPAAEGGAPCPALVAAEPCVPLSTSWHASPWTDCQPLGGSPCGEGIKRRAVRCLRSDGMFVNDSFCQNSTAKEPSESWCYVPCGSDCTVGTWTDWDDSGCRCGEPTVHIRRTRQRMSAAVWPGRGCPVTEQRVPCPLEPCLTLVFKPILECTTKQGHDEDMYCGSGVTVSRVRCKFDWDTSDSDKWTMAASRCSPDLPGRMSMPHAELEETPCTIPCNCSAPEQDAGEWLPWSACRDGVRSRRKQLKEGPHPNCPKPQSHMFIQFMNCTDSDDDIAEGLFPRDQNDDLTDAEEKDLRASNLGLVLGLTASFFVIFLLGRELQKAILRGAERKALKTVVKV